jgi:hypothetical protein
VALVAVFPDRRSRPFRINVVIALAVPQRTSRHHGHGIVTRCLQDVGVGALTKFRASLTADLAAGRAGKRGPHAS